MIPLQEVPHTSLVACLTLLIALAAPVFADSDGSQAYDGYGDGMLVEVNGRDMYIRCVGAGTGPLVVMDSGMGGFSVEWFNVQDMLPEVRSCSYDRAGYGYSDPTAEPRISSLLAEELYELLHAAGHSGPYILVGHSFGGYNVRYFAGAWPASVAGLVLVESAHPEQFERMPSLPGRTSRQVERMAEAGGVQLRPVVVTTYHGEEHINLYPAMLQDTVKALMLSRKSIFTERKEFLGFMHSASELDWVRFPEDAPLAIVHRGRRVWGETPIGNAREQAWMDMQEELAQLSSDSVVLEARASGHMVHMEQPEVVVNAIRWVFRRSCLAGKSGDSSCSSVLNW